eukprot:1158567-Pelagomonas_calceolata.AAC.3
MHMRSCRSRQGYSLGDPLALARPTWIAGCHQHRTGNCEDSSFGRMDIWTEMHATGMTQRQRKNDRCTLIGTHVSRVNRDHGSEAHSALQHRASAGPSSF